MPIWKKSEDPWDMEPGRPVSAAEKPEEGGGHLLDTVKEWGERVKTSLQKEEEPEGPPEVCPWCGKEMKRGYLVGGKGVYWSEKRPTALGGVGYDALSIDDEGSLLSGLYKTVWCCRECRKMVLELPAAPEFQSQRECEEELRGYAEQAKQK